MRNENLEFKIMTKNISKKHFDPQIRTGKRRNVTTLQLTSQSFLSIMS